MDAKILYEMAKAIENRQSVALATIIDVQGPSPAQTGFKLLVWPDGRCAGNVGGGELEKRIRDAARQAIEESRARIVRYSLREEGEGAVGMLCGGDVTVFVEPHVPPPVLLIMGGGHIGRPLSEMACLVGYEVKVVDIRPDRGDHEAFALEEVTEGTYVVIITEDHVTDEKALRDVLPTPAAYIGMIGSRRKVGTVLEHLRDKGFDDEQLDRLRAPIGLDLGGREPEQIALAILAEIEMVRHGGSGRPRSDAAKDGAA